MTEMDKIGRALNDALRPLGYRLHDCDGIRVLREPAHDIYKVYIERIPKAKP